MNKMKNIKPYLVFVLIPIAICVALIINANHFDNQQKEIHKWVADHNYTIVDEDWQLTVMGSPYNYVHKGEYIWKLNVKDSINQPHVVWVRTSSWCGNDYKVEK
jgi:hypothetical protein